MGWARPFLLALKGGYPLSAFPYSELVQLCLYTTTGAGRLTTKNSVLYDISCFTEMYIKRAKKKKKKVLSVLLLQLLRGFTSVNLDKAQDRNVSACAGSMNVSLQKKKAVWNAASRLETVETVATTIANHKNAH